MDAIFGKAKSSTSESTDDSNINFDDIPELTDEQLAHSVKIRPNRAREFVGVRLDWDVLAWLKEFGPGHSTRINQILRAVMEVSNAKNNKKAS